MNKEKILGKLLKKAKLVHSDQIDLAETDFIDMPLENFIDLKGELFFHEERDCFYMLVGAKWFRFQSKIKKEEMDAKSPYEEDLVYLDKRIDEISRWCKDFKDYIDKNVQILDQRISKIEKDQEEFFKEMKQNVDLKLSLLNKEEKSNEAVQGDKRDKPKRSANRNINPKT
jgi:hypothetical protein